LSVVNMYTSNESQSQSMLHGRKALRDRLSLASPPKMTHYATEGVSLIKANVFSGVSRIYPHWIINNAKTSTYWYILLFCTSPLRYQWGNCVPACVRSRQFRQRKFSHLGASTGGKWGSSQKGNFPYKRLFEFLNDIVKS